MRTHLLIPALLSVLALTACEPAKTTPAKLTGAGMDMFTPVKIRVHPLSRLTTTPPSIEARLEFTDQFGDIGKGAGVVRFDLYAYDSISLNHKGARLGHWEFNLSTPENNRDHWDAITRTYLFKLPIDAAALTDRNRFLLIGTLSLLNNQQYTDDITLQR